MKNRKEYQMRYLFYPNLLLIFNSEIVELSFKKSSLEMFHDADTPGKKPHFFPGANAELPL